MVVDTLLDKMPLWISDDAPDAGICVLSQGTLVRNLADFPFAHRCSEDEKRTIETRVLGVLDNLNLLSSGRYYSFQDLDTKEIRFLAERRLASHELMFGRGPRGVYIADDQSFSIAINSQDHISLRVLQCGMQPQEVWSRLNVLDDTLNSLLDFSFNERLGFLTTQLSQVGTGLKLGVLLHLPGLTLSGGLAELAGRAEQQRLLLHGIRAGGTFEARPERMRLAPVGEEHRPSQSRLNQSFLTDLSGSLSTPISQTEGDLFMLTNTGTLGVSEEEIVFQVRHIASELIAEERAARELLLNENVRVLEDRIGRALGLAGGARMLNFNEAVGVLSSLRLGIATGIIQGHTLQQVNELLLACQGEHLEMAAGVDCDDYRLSVERADLFRGRFSSEAKKF